MSDEERKRLIAQFTNLARELHCQAQLSHDPIHKTKFRRMAEHALELVIHFKYVVKPSPNSSPEPQ